MLDRSEDPQQHIVLDYHNPYSLSITQKYNLVNLFFLILKNFFCRGRVSRPGGTGQGLPRALGESRIGRFRDGEPVPYIKSKMEPYWKVPFSFCSTRS